MKINKLNQGSSLMEVLVALVIFSIAVMGVLGQQIRAIQTFYQPISQEMLMLMLLNASEINRLDEDVDALQYDTKYYKVDYHNEKLTIISTSSLFPVELSAPFAKEK